MMLRISRYEVLLLAVAITVFVGGWTMGRASSSIITGGTVITDCRTASPEEDENVLEHMTFSQLSSFLFHRYPAAERETGEDEHELLFDSLMAMEKVEKDGIPIPLQGYPYLFVGGVGTS